MATSTRSLLVGSAFPAGYADLLAETHPIFASKFHHELGRYLMYSDEQLAAGLRFKP